MKWVVGIVLVMLIAHYFFRRAEWRAAVRATEPPPGPDEPPGDGAG